MKRYVCPRECGNNCLAPDRMASDDVRRFCLPCSEETGKMVERVCPARERAKKKRAEARREKRKAERKAAREAAKAAYTLEDGTDVQRMVARVRHLGAWKHEGDRVAAAVKRCHVDIQIGEPRGAHGRAWGTRRVHVHLRRDTHPARAMSIIVHELAHVAHAALRRARGIRGKRYAHDGMFWSLWEAAMLEVYPGLKDKRQLMRANRDALVAENKRLAAEHQDRAFSAQNHYAMEWANGDLIEAAHAEAQDG